VDEVKVAVKEDLEINSTHPYSGHQMCSLDLNLVHVLQSSVGHSLKSSISAELATLTSCGSTSGYRYCMRWAGGARVFKRASKQKADSLKKIGHDRAW